VTRAQRARATVLPRAQLEGISAGLDDPGQRGP